MRQPISPSTVIVTLVLSRNISDILQVLCLRPHPYSTLILGVFPLDQIAYVGIHPRRKLKLLLFKKLFLKYSNLCERQYLNVTDRQTVETDRRLAVA